MKKDKRQKKNRENMPCRVAACKRVRSPLKCDGTNMYCENKKHPNGNMHCTPRFSCFWSCN